LAEAPTVGEIVAVLAICWPAATLVVTALLFWLGIPIGPLHLWAGLVVALIASRIISHSWRLWLVATISVAVMTVAAGATLAWLYDFSGDGQWYHLPAILALAQGWNPFQHPQLGEWNAAFEQAISERPSAAIYVQHYAKGTWIVAAAVYRAIGLLEAAKAVNLLYSVAVYLLAAGYLRRMWLSRPWAHGLALAAAANPVVLYQVPSFFVDGQVAALCALLVLLSLEFLRAHRPYLLVLLAASVVLLANVKFTGVVFAIALGGGFVVFYWLKGERELAGRYAVAGFLSAALAVAVVGYQPYLTNLRFHGNPFFPVLDRDEAADRALAGQFERWAPPEFIALGRVGKLTRSLLAESAGAESMPRLKVPFTLAKRELYIFFNTEPRYGGFGPLFGSALLATVLLLVAGGRSMDRRVLAGAGALAVLLTLSTLLNREAWWARLSPQFWLVPVVVLSAIAMGGQRWSRRVGALLLALLLANSALVAALNWSRAVEKNREFRARVSELQARAKSAPLEIAIHSSFRMVTEHRLRGMAVPYERVPKATCQAPLRFSYPEVAQASACPGRSP
jgi:hypothetical protein